jgi:FkbM family methyltransferase
MGWDSNYALPSPRRSRYMDWICRSDTNDAALVVGIIAGDEYQLGTLPELSGWAIDIGAHIGIVAVALGIDHPDLRIIAVEAVPQNVAGLRINVEHNHLEERVVVVEAAADRPGAKRTTLLWDYRSAENVDEAYSRDSRYIANIFGSDSSDADEHTIPSVSLDSLMRDNGIDRVTLLKIDCEGCEWGFLRSKRVKDVDTIIGEFHNEGGLDALRGLLKWHDVIQLGGSDQVGIFRATHK